MKIRYLAGIFGAAASITLLAPAWALSNEHAALIAQTPCLRAVRDAAFGLPWNPPPDVTPEQCDAARAVHERILEEERQNRLKEIAADDRRQKAAAQLEAELRALASRPGASIGMTAYEVTNKTNWGWPASVRRTTTANGRSETWFYDGGVLHFRDGRLVMIQN
jgi:hypothetical protein